MAWHFQIVVDNCAVPPLAAEHGLAIYCRHDDGRRFLFDTGAGTALAVNLRYLHIIPQTIPAVILSHGHNDHTGGIAEMRHKVIFYHTPEIMSSHYSRHPGKTTRTLTMPPEARNVLKQAKRRIINTFTEISPGVWLTGPIPRISGEDTGGPFFTEENGGAVDNINDEQAVFFADGGTLLQGCCHAGIINTIDWCRKNLPDCRIRRIIGGLHLLNAGEKRLQETVAALKAGGIEELHLMHCTGGNAVDYLRQNLPATAIFTPTAGDTI